MPGDEDRVFDVSRPHKTPPSPTSRPVIVGHHPEVVDPMVSERRPTEPHHDQPPTPAAAPTPVPIAVHDSVSNMDSQKSDDSPLLQHHQPPVAVPEAEAPESAPAPTEFLESKPPELQPVVPAGVHEPEPSSAAVPPVATDSAIPAASPVPPVGAPAANAGQQLDDLPLPSHHPGHPDHSAHTHQPAAKRANRKQQWILLALVAAVGAYLALDATTSLMPVHIFHKKKTPAASSTPPVSSSTSGTSTTTTSGNPYAGWVTYTSPAEKFTFKYPSTWTVHKAAASTQTLEGVSFDGPNHFTLSYEVTKIDSAQATPADQQKTQTYDPNSNTYQVVEPLTVKNYSQPLYLEVDQTQFDGGNTAQSMGVSAYQTYVSQPYAYPSYYPAKNNSGFIVQWDGAYSTASGAKVPLSHNQFMAKAEGQTAKLILESLSY